MFSKFKYKRLDLKSIRLDDRNPRIVTQSKLSSQQEIVRYFFEHEGLGKFLAKIASEGKNPGAERPYVVSEGDGFVVVEGNTRIAAYKLLSGEIAAPPEFSSQVPQVSDALKKSLEEVHCAIAPSRDDLLPIMANAHFGMGDKSKWGYLGSRKAVYDEWMAGKSIAQLAAVFDRRKGQIRDLIVEYLMYLEALKLKWTKDEKAALTDPSVEFNPPVRFLQSAGHKDMVGIEIDRVNMEILFVESDAQHKFRHLVKKLVIESEQGMKATATYNEVFKDYKPNASPETSTSEEVEDDEDAEDDNGVEQAGSTNSDSSQSTKKLKLKPNALFDYPVKKGGLLMQQLMKEAAAINSKSFPAASTSLLRSVLEAILKILIEEHNANKQNKLLSLETALDICLGSPSILGQDDRKILKEFKKHHLDYINLGAHATVVPNASRVLAARDCVDQFVRRHA